MQISAAHLWPELLEEPHKLADALVRLAKHGLVVGGPRIADAVYVVPRHPAPGPPQSCRRTSTLAMPRYGHTPVERKDGLFADVGDVPRHLDDALTLVVLRCHVPWSIASVGP